MKKLIIFLMLAVFCLSLTPLFAMDYNPYGNDNISATPNSDGDPWDDLKKTPIVKDDKDSLNVSGQAVVPAKKLNPFIELIKKIIPHSNQDKKDECKK